MYMCLCVYVVATSEIAALISQSWKMVVIAYLLLMSHLLTLSHILVTITCHCAHICPHRRKLPVSLFGHWITE